MSFAWFCYRSLAIETSCDCWECGDELAPDDARTDDDGDSFCESCYESRYTSCHNCDCEVKRDDCRTSNDGDDYCEDCYYDSFSSCESCCEEVANDDIVSSDSGACYCQSCYDEAFTHCYDCRCEISVDDCRTDDDGDSFCESCYYDRYTFCEGCGEECSNDSVNSDGYCEHCRSDEEWDSSPVSANGNAGRIGSNRRFGAELETSRADDLEAIRESCNWGCKPDGSITGREFVSPILSGETGAREVSAFCRAANDADFKTDGRCGFHLHVDLSDLSARQLHAVAVGYAATHRLWFAFIPESRRANNYCKPWRADKIAFALDSARHSIDQAGLVVSNCTEGRTCRYFGINFASFTYLGTVEIRLHTATLDEDKVLNWAAAHTRFVDWCAARRPSSVAAVLGNKTTQQQFWHLVDDVWRDTELGQFYRDRAAKFGTELTMPTSHSPDGSRKRRFADNAAKRRHYAQSRAARFARRFAIVDAQ